MASPQIENGHTRIANELLENIIRINLSGSQLRVLLWIIRKSYGWKEKQTRYACYSYMVGDTDLPESSVRWAIKKLIERNLIIPSTPTGQFSINKDYEKWVNKTVWITQPIAQPIAEKPQPIAEKPQPIADAYKELKKHKETLKGATPPSHPQVRDYVEANKLQVDPDYFCDYYTSKGWMIGKSKMKDWKAAARNWSRRAIGETKNHEKSDILV